MCGVSDYARLLAAELHEMTGWTGLHVVANHDGQGTAGESDGPVFLTHHTPGNLRATLTSLKKRPDAVVLHFSGYGYHRWGAPAWLALGLSETRRTSPPPVILTMFHELFTTGKPSSKAFWLGLWQKRVVSKIATFSDGVRTNCHLSREWLVQHTRHGPLVPHAVPVFSNLGEPQAPASIKPPSVAMLVPTGIAHAASSEWWETVVTAARHLGCKRLVVIGKTAPTPELTGSDLQLEHHGHLAPEAYSSILSSVHYGFLNYNPDYLGKSGMLGAYAAHHLVPVIQRAAGHLPDGLTEGEHFITAPMSPVHCRETDRHRITLALHAWYARHSLRATALAYAQQLEGLVDAPPTD